MTRTATFFDAIPPEALAALEDTSRIQPMLAGVGWVSGHILTLRLPEGDLEIQAPARLLKRAFALCDGRRSRDAVLATLPTGARDEFDRFLRFLMQQGAVIDGALMTRRMIRFGELAIAPGKTASNAVRRSLAERVQLGASAPEVITCDIQAAPLDVFFATRQSTLSFAQQPVARSALNAFLWSASGVVAGPHVRPAGNIPRRTQGSAGALHLLEWRLVLQRPVEDLTPGVYRISFPDVRQIGLQRISDDIETLPRCFEKPWYLGAAAGALFAVADIRLAALSYQNRALQYLFLEAGAAFQNLELSCAALGLAGVQIGGYAEEFVTRLCQLSSETILGSFIFGARPGEAEQRAAREAFAIDFLWADTPTPDFATPFFLGRARPKGKTDAHFNTWGRDADPRLAYIKAHAEAVEREAMRRPRAIEVARYRDLPAAIPPDRIATYLPSQFRLQGFPHTLLEEDKTYHWLRATRLIDGDEVFVPAQFVHGLKALESIPITGGSLLQCNSSGCAAGSSLEAALHAALLEVVERDAYMRHWLAQRPGRRLAPERLPHALARRIEALRAAGCEVVAQVLESPFAQVCLVSARHDTQHFTALGAAARPQLEAALTAAFDELETTVQARLLGEGFEPISPRAVVTPADHARLYAQPRYYRRADTILTPATDADWPENDGTLATCSALSDKMQELQIEPCVVDITPEQNTIDQGRIELHVVKVVAPGLVPISFGKNLEPRGMVVSLCPASAFPHPFP